MFQIDLNQMLSMINHCSEYSLLLVDEFGKGTEQFSGCAILAATISHLLQRTGHCPRAVFTTHFWQLFDNALLPVDHPSLTLSHMAVSTPCSRLVLLGLGQQCLLPGAPCRQRGQHSYFHVSNQGWLFCPWTLCSLDCSACWPEWHCHHTSIGAAAQNG